MCFSFKGITMSLMFDEELLRDLDFDDLEGINFNPAITQNDPGENLRMRPLSREDYNHGRCVNWEGLSVCFGCVGWEPKCPKNPKQMGSLSQASGSGYCHLIAGL